MALNIINLSIARLPSDCVDDSEQGTSIDHIDVLEADIAELISSINPHKATGPDGISPQILKEAGPAIVPSFTRLIKLSLKKCKIPKQWKKVNVIPIHKKDKKDLLNNYRPISLLPVPSKILERIIFKQVYNHLHRNKLLSKDQSGFRPNDSTVNQLAFMYHEFCKALDAKKDIRIVFCDISKVFDKVWHQGLLHKLRKAGIKCDLLDWFKDYLTDRKQRVVIRGQCSNWGNIMAGVPQGSVLGPLLFLIYINDLASVVKCNLKMFADDTCLYVTVDDPTSSATTLNDNLNNIKHWANQWLVKFNPDKIKSMVLTNKNVVHTPLYFNNKHIEQVHQHKHLGLLFNTRLSWKDHVSEIIQGVSKLLDVMHKLSKDLDRRTLETIHETFVRSKLEYACVIWDDCSDQDSDSIENCQLRAARIVTGAKKGTSHNRLYDETQWPQLKERRHISS